MPIPRFFCLPPLSAHETVTLPRDVAHHATRVLRLSDGAELTLFDGRGGEFPATLILGEGSPQAAVRHHDPVERELAGTLVLVQGMASGNKMDWIVEKAVELGVSALYPVSAARSVLRLSGARMEKRLGHWRSIVRSASEQCGRNRLMAVHAPADLAQCLPHLTGTILCAHPDSQKPLMEAVRETGNPLNVLVGPEGGWTDDELKTAEAHGALSVCFGSRVLRTETAGMAMACAATALLDW